jgi:hypothetical protein
MRRYQGLKPSPHKNAPEMTKLGDHQEWSARPLRYEIGFLPAKLSEFAALCMALLPKNTRVGGVGRKIALSSGEFFGH